MREDAKAEVAAIREHREALQFELSETRKVRDQLLSMGQMQAILLALLERSPKLSSTQLNEIANADRKMRALDLGLPGRLKRELERRFADAGVARPSIDVAGPGSSLDQA